MWSVVDIDTRNTAQWILPSSGTNWINWPCAWNTTWNSKSRLAILLVCPKRPSKNSPSCSSKDFVTSTRHQRCWCESCSFRLAPFWINYFALIPPFCRTCRLALKIRVRVCRGLPCPFLPLEFQSPSDTILFARNFQACVLNLQFEIPFVFSGTLTRIRLVT